MCWWLRAPRPVGTGHGPRSTLENRTQAERALQVGADVLVAQGTEAGGHGPRSTFHPRSPGAWGAARHRTLCILVEDDGRKFLAYYDGAMARQSPGAWGAARHRTLCILVEDDGRKFLAYYDGAMATEGALTSKLDRVQPASVRGGSRVWTVFVLSVRRAGTEGALTSKLDRVQPASVRGGSRVWTVFVLSVRRIVTASRPSPAASSMSAGPSTR